MKELSRFEYPEGMDQAYDPVLRLRVATEPGRQCMEWKFVNIGIHHDPEIEAARSTMPQPNYAPWEIEMRKTWNWDFDRPVPFQSSRSRQLANLLCYAHDCGDRIRLKVHCHGEGLRSYHLRGSIEQMRIPLISNDVSSMYVGVIKAYPGLPSLRESRLSPERFPNARTIEICVTTSALKQGLGRSVDDYPMVEGPVPGWVRPPVMRSASVEAASLKDEGWHCLASWPMQLPR